MFSEDILKKFSAAFSIPVQLYDNDKLLMTCAEQFFTPNPAYYLMHPYIHQNYPVCFLITPDYILNGYIEIGDSSQFLILGPASPYEISSRQAENLLNEMKLSKSRHDEMIRWFHYLPEMNISNFRNMLDFLNTIINPGSKENPIHVTYQVQHINLSYSKDMDLVPDIHINNVVEHELQKMIEYGKVSELADYFDSLSSNPEITLADLASNAIRSLKNTFIGSVALCSRAAIRGGLDYDTAISLSDYYISKIEKQQLFSDVNELLRTMILDFTKRVSLSTKANSDSATVNAVFRDVQKHLHEKITSRDISRHLSLERTYLCHHFKEKTGKTLTTYIQEQKIKEARYLLETSDLPIILIADKLGYSSQQQFQTVFKKMTGTTPNRFRNSLSN